jgi:uncharacterized repeat protein (TIGR03803 family)
MIRTSATPSSRPKWAKLIGIICLLYSAAIVSPGQTFKTLVNFDATTGGDPLGSPVQGTDGNLYGTTGVGGANNGGTVYRMTPTGDLAIIYNFCAQTDCADGSEPLGGLVLATDGNFYGTTRYGGTLGVGTVFKITPYGTFSTLFSFDHVHGACPEASLVQGFDGALYGTTATGGVEGRGTVFKISLDGALTTLYKIGSKRSDGSNPLTALTLSTDGTFYGTTTWGGDYTCANGCGTVFTVTPTGTFTTLHKFRSVDGAAPGGVLLQASDGNLYGTTNGGGDNQAGTVFRMSKTGELTTLHSFGSSEGMYPLGGLNEGTDGNLYGTTTYGGTHDSGIVFTITTAGLLTTLGNFGNGNGSSPISSMFQDTTGLFYGTATYAGSNGYGTVFAFSIGLGPFVRTLPLTGTIGSAVQILGTDLNGTTSVTFNGSAATFTVISLTLIKTTVPAGATTGTVQVTTSNSMLTSNAVFRVN